MRRFVEGIDRGQATLFPECLEDWIDENNPVRVIDAFVDKLDLSGLWFDGVAPEATGRPSYHPSVLLKLYIYGYLVRVQSSRRLEREAGRNVEVMWLTSRLVPDHKTIADFRKDSGPAIKQACVQFVELCRLMGLLTTASVAIDGSKFKAVNTRDKSFTRGKVERRRAQLEKSVARYLAQLDTADLQEPSEELVAKTAHLKEKLVKLESEMQRLAAVEPGNEAAFEVLKELARTRRRNADEVDPGIGRTRMGQRIFECVLSIGTRSAQSIMASGLIAAQKGRTHDRTRPMLQLGQKVLAKAPSTHDPKRKSSGRICPLLTQSGQVVSIANNAMLKTVRG
jgi:transposase